MEIKKNSIYKFNKNIQFREELVNWKIDQKKISTMKHSKDGEDVFYIVPKVGWGPMDRSYKKENFCSTEGKTF